MNFWNFLEQRRPFAGLIGDFDRQIARLEELSTNAGFNAGVEQAAQRVCQITGSCWLADKLRELKP